MEKIKFCKLVREAIKDEKGADEFYRKMKKVAPRQVIGLINRIQRDERNHGKMFKRFHKDYC